MSLDETGIRVWQTTRPPLAILVAGGATEMLAGDLEPADRAPFLALTRALEAWWPRRMPEPAKICSNEFRACLNISADHAQPTKMAPVLAGARLQMAAVLPTTPGSLPAEEGFYDLGEEDFIKLLRDAAKAARLPVAQLDARLKHLVEHEKTQWPDLVARSRRMGWDRRTRWGKLSKRVKDLASLADLGATASWTEVSSKRALRLELDGTKRVAMLEPEELATLTAVIPSLADPG